MNFTWSGEKRASYGPLFTEKELNDACLSWREDGIREGYRDGRFMGVCYGAAGAAAAFGLWIVLALAARAF